MPYFYKIKHLPTGKYYVGSQYSKKCNSKNLLKQYKTSSKYVKKLIDEYGENSFVIVKIIEREDARKYEEKYLRKVYNILGKTKFMKIMINRNIAPGILLTKESIEQANKKRAPKLSKSAKNLLKLGIHNFQKNNASNYDHVRKQRSERAKGNNWGSNRNITEEYRKIQSLGAKGNTNVRGTKWWTNGVVNKRSKNKPDDDFYLGTTKRIKINE